MFQSRGEGMSIKFIQEPFTWILEPYVAERSCVKHVDCNPFYGKPLLPKALRVLNLGQIVF